MKKLVISFAILLSTTAFAANPPVDEKVSEMFTKIFPGAEKVKWYEYADSYEVMFENNQIPCRAKYDKIGNIVSLRRDYDEKNLSFFIKAKLKEKYPDKKIFGVTEMNSTDGISYTITLHDDKTWLTVHADDSGRLSVVQRLKKAL